MTMLRAHSFHYYYGNPVRPWEPGVSWNGVWYSGMGGRTTSLEGGIYQCVYCNNQNNSHWIKTTLQAGRDELFLQVCVYATNNTMTTAQKVIEWFNGSTILGCVVLQPDLTMQFWVGDKDTGTLVATSSLQLRADGTWACYEFHIKIGASGQIQFRKDYVLDVNFSGNTLLEGATGLIDNINFWRGIVGISTPCLADIIVNDALATHNNSWPLGAHCAYAPPKAAGTNTGWTPSAGQNYACVDDHIDMGDFVYTNTPGVKDSYPLKSLPAGASTVLALIPFFFGVKTGASAVSNVKRLIHKQVGGDYEGSPMALPVTNPGMFGGDEVIEVDPETGDPFTVSDINTGVVELGMTSVA